MLSKKHQKLGWQTFLDDTNGLWWRRRSEYNPLQYLFSGIGAEGLEEVKERSGIQAVLDCIAEACFN